MDNAAAHEFEDGTDVAPDVDVDVDVVGAVGDESFPLNFGFGFLLCGPFELNLDLLLDGCASL